MTSIPLPGRTSGGYREVIPLALPLVFSMLAQTLIVSVEAALLGRLSPVAQGAAGLGAALLWPLLVLCNCSGMGVQICVAQAHGAQRRADCGTVVWQGLYLSLLAWIPLLIAGVGTPFLVQLSAPGPQLIEPTIVYVRVLFFGGLPALLNVPLGGFFRGLGDTGTTLLVTVCIRLLNALLAVLLIFGVAGFPRLEIMGAALATVIANAVGTVLYGILFVRRGRREGLFTRLWVPFDWPTCWHLLRLSWPIGAQGVVEVGAWSLFTTLIARLGTVEAAAHAIAMRFLSLAYMTGYGIAVATTTLIGQSLGAQDHLAARRSMRACLSLAMVVMGSMGVGFLVWRQPLVAVFTDDPAVRAMGVRLMVLVALFQGCDGLTLVATGVLRGAGQTRWPMLAGILLNWGVFVPATGLVLLYWRGGIMAGWAVALGVAVVLGVVMLRRVLRGVW